MEIIPGTIENIRTARCPGGLIHLQRDDTVWRGSHQGHRRINGRIYGAARSCASVYLEAGLISTDRLELRQGEGHFPVSGERVTFHRKPICDLRRDLIYSVRHGTPPFSASIFIRRILFLSPQALALSR